MEWLFILFVMLVIVLIAGSRQKLLNQPLAVDVSSSALGASLEAVHAAGEGVVNLPRPSLVGSRSLDELMTLRKSIREFDDVPLTLAELSQLLWAAQGVLDSGARRMAPSAGALYPLEIYVLKADGVYHYEPQLHQLVLVSDRDIRSALYDATLEQEALLEAPVTFVLAAVYARTAKKYGMDRALRYAHLEAGHAAQNLLLQASALNLGGLPVGAFWDREVKDVLGIPNDHEPLYLIPVGHPR